MMLRVIYHNGKYDMVKDLMLEIYINSGKILKFRRKDGWATIGIDPIRDRGHNYIGPERRRV